MIFLESSEPTDLFIHLNILLFLNFISVNSYSNHPFQIEKMIVLYKTTAAFICFNFSSFLLISIQTDVEIVSSYYNSKLLRSDP